MPKRFQKSRFLWSIPVGNPFVFLNGKIVKLSNAKISVTDSAFLRGVGVYEVWFVRNGQPHLFYENFREFQRGMKICHIRFSFSAKKIKEIISELLKKNKLSTARVRLTATPENVLIEVTPLPIYPPTASVCTVQAERVLPIVKSVNCLVSVLARQEANRKNADEALLVNKCGEVTEGTMSNLFLVKNGKIFTPPKEDVHPRVVRVLVFRLAKKLKISIQEKKIKLKEVDSVDEIFLTGSLTGIRAIIYLNGKAVGKGKIGRITSSIQKAFQETLP